MRIMSANKCMYDEPIYTCINKKQYLVWDIAINHKSTVLRFHNTGELLSFRHKTPIN